MFVLIGIILMIISIVFLLLIVLLDELEHKGGLENIDKSRKAKKVNKILLPIEVMCFAIGLGSLLFSVIYSNEVCKTVTYEYLTDESIDIYALKDNVSQSGSYFLGTGSVGGKTYYYYYELSDDGYKYSKISPEDYNIYLNPCNENETPHIDTLYKYGITRINDDDYWLVSLKALFNREDYSVGTVVKMKKYSLFKQYKIYVPDGSIVNDYKIDLE